MGFGLESEFQMNFAATPRSCCRLSTLGTVAQYLTQPSVNPAKELDRPWCFFSSINQRALKGPELQQFKAHHRNFAPKSAFRWSKWVLRLMPSCLPRTPPSTSQCMIRILRIRQWRRTTSLPPSSQPFMMRVRSSSSYLGYRGWGQGVFLISLFISAWLSIGMW